jgi:hypothetical protein
MKKAYFCIDGFSFKRINDFYKYEHKRRSRINIAAVETYLRYEIERRLEWKSDYEHLAIEKHFYQPREKLQRDSDFERNLISSGYTIHCASENIFAEWIIARALRTFDIFVLLSTQGQYANIFRQTKMCRIPSMLIGWESHCKNSAGGDSQWKTDKRLIENASSYCPLERILNQPVRKKLPLVEIMFEKFFPRYPSAPQCG